MSKINSKALLPDFIIEVANEHGGDLEHLLDTIRQFERFEGHGIKFQPLHPDEIALPDYEWYSVYQQLLFNEVEWGEILNLAAQTKEVFLDLFDSYGVTILRAHRDVVRGVKFQPSVIQNTSIWTALDEVDCRNLKFIVNLSGFEQDYAREVLFELQRRFSPRVIFAEVGFQGYPTAANESGVHKIQFFKHELGLDVVFADHSTPECEDGFAVSSAAIAMGAACIEKHVRNNNREVKYDFQSAVTDDQFERFCRLMNAIRSSFESEWINEAEASYLSKSLQRPILSRDLDARDLISLERDLIFKRTNRVGLSFDEIQGVLGKRQILGQAVCQNEPLELSSFEPARIGVVVACRLKSSRLLRKALLPIGSVTSVEKCLQSCRRISGTTGVYLATSDLEEDQVLRIPAEAQGAVFYKGDPLDVIGRYLGIARKEKLDVIVRVTADMPYVSAEIAELLIRSHFELGADYSGVQDCAVGTAVEVISVRALERVAAYFGTADYSEYMTWYFRNNPEHFRLNLVDLPADMIRGYRLTLDYQEDLDLFERIQFEIDNGRVKENLKDIFEFLDAHPDVAAINGHLGLKYRTDPELIATLNRMTKMDAAHK